jgi:hypothetical protein
LKFRPSVPILPVILKSARPTARASAQAAILFLRRGSQSFGNPEGDVLYAQRKAPFTPRTNPGRGGYRPAPIRARVGLAMRRAMNFGALADAESVMRSRGLSLAPMSVGAAGLSVGGTSILPTAQTSDIDNGALKALVIPAGQVDVDAAAALNDAVVRASAKGAPVIAFGDAVETALRALDRPVEPYAQAEAVLITADTVEALSDSAALAVAASRIQ